MIKMLPLIFCKRKGKSINELIARKTKGRVVCIGMMTQRENFFVLNWMLVAGDLGVRY